MNWNIVSQEENYIKLIFFFLGTYIILSFIASEISIIIFFLLSQQ